MKINKATNLLLLTITISFNCFSQPNNYPCIDCSEQSKDKIVLENNILIGYLNANCFEYLEDYFNKLQKKFDADEISDYEMLIHFDAFRPYSTQANIVKWLDKYPESYAANLVMGLFYRNTAFNLRGSAYIKYTPDINISLMNSALQESERYFDKAISLTKNHSYIQAYKLRVYMFEGRENEYNTLANSIINDNKNAITPYPIIMEYLQPKWGGSLEKMKEFFFFSKKHNLPQWQLNFIEGTYLSALYQHLYDNKQFAEASSVASREYEIAPDKNTKIIALNNIVQAKQLVTQKDIKARLESIEKELKEVSNLDPENLYSIGMLGLLDVQRNNVQAGIEKLKKASTGNIKNPDGDSISEYHLGLIYISGKFVDENKDLGIKYLLMAQKQGHNDAGYQLTKLGVIPTKI